MLSEKVANLQKNVEILTKVDAIIKKAKPIVKGMEEVRVELSNFLTDAGNSTLDLEIKTAIESVKQIFESACNGLQDQSVSALFN